MELGDLGGYQGHHLASIACWEAVMRNSPLGGPYCLLAPHKSPWQRFMPALQRNMHECKWLLLRCSCGADHRHDKEAPACPGGGAPAGAVGRERWAVAERVSCSCPNPAAHESSMMALEHNDIVSTAAGQEDKQLSLRHVSFKTAAPAAPLLIICAMLSQLISR